MKIRPLHSFLALVALALNAQATLTTNRWQVNSGKWEIGANWDQGVPTNSDSINLITKTTPALGRVVTIDDVTSASNLLNNCLTISNLTINGSVLSPNTLEITNSTSVFLKIVNMLNIDNHGSLVMPSAPLYVSVSAIKSIGQMTVSSGGGATLKELHVGYSGSGTLTVAGGNCTVSTLSGVGAGADSTGVVWVTGGFLRPGDITVGVDGVGRMTLSNGTVEAGNLNLAIVSGSQGTLTVAGGLLSVTNSGSALTIGDAARGVMIMSGGTGVVASAVVGGSSSSSATGTVWMSGGQFTVINDVLIGNGSTGLMTMSNGLVFADDLMVGTSNSGNGTLTMVGGTNQLSGDLALGLSGTATGVVTMTGGLLTATNSASQTILVGSNGVGRLTVGNAILLGEQLKIASKGSSSGSVTINSGGTLACVGPVVIGSATSTGWLTVAGGQFMITNTPEAAGVSTGLFVDGSITESNGTISVPTSLTAIGNHGVGSLTVHHGSNDLQSLDLGELTGSTGTLTMNGGTNSISFEFILGKGSGATGTIWLNGDRLNTGIANIGWDGVGIMTMSGGVWRSTGQVNVGQLNRGTLTVAGGTMIVDGTALVVPHGSTVPATVWLTGGQVIATNSLISLGEAGGGILTVSNALLSAQDVYIATNASSTGAGTLTVAAGTNNVYRSLLIGAGNCVGTGVVNVAGGRLFVTNATATALLEVRSGTVMLNSGTLTIDKLVMTNACGHFLKTGGALSITATNLAPNLDADGDGLPNSWEQGFGLSPFDNTGNNGASGDPDGDGFSNLQEYLGGSNPLSAGSTPDAIWNTSSSGKWEVGGNWLATVPPTNNQAVFITQASLKTVTIDTATPTNNMSIKSLTVSSGNTLQITNTGPAAPLRVSNDASITLGGILSVKDAAATMGTLSIEVQGSVLLTNGSLVTHSQDVRGRLSLMDSVVTNQLDMNVAFQIPTPAELWMSGGSFVDDLGGVTIGGGVFPGASCGRMTVSNGYASVFQLYIGYGTGDPALGTLTCAGGTTEATRTLWIGTGPGSTGTVWLTGGELAATNVNVTTTMIGVGQGRGLMTVSNGTVRLQNVAVGSSFSSGAITINGGTVYATNVTLGVINCTGTGTVIVAGGNLFVTNAVGAATLEVLSGTVALNSGAFTVDRLVITNACGHFVKTGGTLIQNSPPTLGAGLDADGDGMNNDFEQAHGLDPLDGSGANGANGDPDGDGFTNLQEFQYGSDPQNPNSSPFHITSVVKQGNDVLLTWLAAGGKTNVVQVTKGSTGGIYSNNFADLSGNIVSNVVGLTSETYLDVGGATNTLARYYRVRLVP